MLELYKLSPKEISNWNLLNNKLILIKCVNNLKDLNDIFMISNDNSINYANSSISSKLSCLWPKLKTLEIIENSIQDLSPIKPIETIEKYLYNYVKEALIAFFIIIFLFIVFKSIKNRKKNYDGEKKYT